MKKLFLFAGALSAGIAVATGAFGAHALKDFLAETGRADVFETAVKYQFFHAFALMIVAILAHLQILSEKYSKASGIAFLIGAILFSGSLYILCLTDTPMWGTVTPFGGLAFIVGWIAVARGALKQKTPPERG